jgi:hypothetical protein
MTKKQFTLEEIKDLPADNDVEVITKEQFKEHTGEEFQDTIDDSMIQLFYSKKETKQLIEKTKFVIMLDGCEIYKKQECSGICFVSEDKQTWNILFFYPY